MQLQGNFTEFCMVVSMHLIGNVHGATMNRSALHTLKAASKLAIDADMTE